MVDVRVQKAFNFAYGRLKIANSAFRVAGGPSGAPPKPSPGAAKFMEHFRLKLEEAAEQFNRIYRLEGHPSLHVASDLTMEGAAFWKLAEATQPESAEFFALVGQCSQKLQAAQNELKLNCPIKYGFWLPNPWRHYPVKLP